MRAAANQGLIPPQESQGKPTEGAAAARQNGAPEADPIAAALARASGWLRIARGHLDDAGALQGAGRHERARQALGRWDGAYAEAARPSHVWKPVGRGLELVAVWPGLGGGGERSEAGNRAADPERGANNQAAPAYKQEAPCSE